MAIIISAILPIALVAIAGILLGRFFALDVRSLARVNIYAMLPALVLTSLTEMTLDVGSTVRMMAAFYLHTALLYGLALTLGRSLKLSRDGQKGLLATTLFANVGNMGLPFILFTLGDAGLERAVVYLVASSLMVASIFPVILTGDGFKAGLIYTVKLPVFWVALLAIALRSLEFELPEAIARSSSLLGAGVIPLALLTLGIQLSQSTFRLGRYEFFGAFLRLVVSPIMAYGIGKLINLSGLDLQVLVLQAAMPVAVSSLIWVAELGGNAERVSRTIVLSTLLSCVSLPLIVLLII
ncbi:MAG: AEC family transporter [Cyanobacteria bacterium P01_F01_bin.42]